MLALVHHLSLNVSVPVHSVRRELSRCLFLTVLLILVWGAFMHARVSIVLALVRHLSFNVSVLQHFA